MTYGSTGIDVFYGRNVIVCACSSSFIPRSLETNENSYFVGLFVMRFCDFLPTCVPSNMHMPCSNMHIRTLHVRTWHVRTYLNMDTWVYMPDSTGTHIAPMVSSRPVFSLEYLEGLERSPYVTFFSPDYDSDMRRRHVISPGFSGNYQDLGISSRKCMILPVNLSLAW